MKQFLLLLTTCFIPWLTCAQETADDAGFLEFLNADPKAPPSADANTPAAMLEKWTAHEKAQIEKLHRDLTAARKIAGEMLTKKALTLTGPAQSDLQAETERISSLEAGKLLTYDDSRDPTKYAGVLGVWVDRNAGWTHEFLPQGIVKYDTGQTGTWWWIDADAGVLGHGKHGADYADLIWLERPGQFRYINRQRTRFKLVKSSGPSAVATDPIVRKLHAQEQLQRSQHTLALRSQMEKVLAWLKRKADATSTSEEDKSSARQAMKDLLDVAVLKPDSALRLHGFWRWDKDEIIFQDGGAVVSRIGTKPLGRWNWLSVDQLEFGVVMRGGHTPAEIQLASPPTTPRQPSIQVYRLDSGQFTATRTFP